jgi:hypothetical protein
MSPLLVPNLADAGAVHFELRRDYYRNDGQKLMMNSRKGLFNYKQQLAVGYVDHWWVV